MQCIICKRDFKGPSGIVRHLKTHDISPKEYVTRFLHGGVVPLCQCGCGEQTNFTTSKGFGFKKFVRGHKNSAVKKKIEQKRKNTCLEKYGTKCALQNEEVASKSKATMQERYGVSHYSKTKEYRKKYNATSIERYGAEHFFKSEDYRKSLKKKKRLTYDQILEYCSKKDYVPLFNYSEYEYARDKQNFWCKKHEEKFVSKVKYVQKDTGLQCPKCKSAGISQQEKEVLEFVRTIYSGQILENTKGIISPYEIDIYLPELSLGIEYSGLYWHSEGNKSKQQVAKKYQKSQEVGTQLLEIFEDEWRDKQDIWKSILKTKLGLADHKRDARKLSLDFDPPTKEVRKFVDENHLQGYCRSNKKFVLRNKEGEIVFCVTTRNPFVKQKEKTLEIARVCSKKNFIVRGAFSRLMKYICLWAKEKGYRQVLTYSDNRYSKGQTYKSYGFEFDGQTDPGYDYTDFVDRYGRFGFRAQDGKTQEEVVEENGVVKIYNSGNKRWRLYL